MKSLPWMLAVGVLAGPIFGLPGRAAPGEAGAYADARHALAVLEHSPGAADLRDEIKSGPDDLASERAAAKEDGIPLDPAQLQAPPPQGDENAAPLYVQIGQLLQDKPLGLPDYAVSGMSTRHAYTGEQVAAVQKIYDSRPDVWHLIHQAADKPQCVFPRDWGRGAAVTFPELPTLREAARLIETESYLLARRGRSQEAVSHQGRGFRVAKQAAFDPSLVSYVAGCACDSIAVAGMESILSLAGPNWEVGGEAQEVVDAHRSELSLRRGLIGEMATRTADFNAARASFAPDKSLLSSKLSPIVALGPKDLPAFSPADQRFLRLLWAAQEAQYRHDLRTLIDNADQPLAVRKSVFSQPQAEMEENPRDPVKYLSNVLLPAVARADRNGDRVRTQEDVLLAAAAALSARARTGDYPPTQPLTTLDSFNLRPLQYRAEGANGFVVYSLGPKGDFDGGKPGDRRQLGQAYFRYPAVPDGPSETPGGDDAPAP